MPGSAKMVSQPKKIICTFWQIPKLERHGTNIFLWLHALFVLQQVFSGERWEEENHKALREAFIVQAQKDSSWF